MGSAATELKETAEPTDEAPKRRGRPPKPPVPYEGPTFGLSATDLTDVPVARLLQDDTTFQCRVTLKPELLVDSIRHHGIQMPLVLRTHPKKEAYQIICGFRRAAAAGQVGLETVPAVIRELTDEEAHILSYAENENRKTLSDLDRANGIVKLRQEGKTAEEVAQLYRLRERQVRKLAELVEYPDVVKRALDDEGSGVTTAHAVMIMMAARKHGAGFEVGQWIGKVRRGKPSVEELKQMIRKEVSPGGRPRTLFRQNDKRAVVDIARFEAATSRAREKVIGQVEALLKDLKQRHREASGT